MKSLLAALYKLWSFWICHLDFVSMFCCLWTSKLPLWNRKSTKALLQLGYPCSWPSSRWHQQPEKGMCKAYKDTWRIQETSKICYNFQIFLDAHFLYLYLYSTGSLICWNSLLRLSSPGDPNAVSQALEEVLKMAPKLDAKELRRLS